MTLEPRATAHPSTLLAPVEVLGGDDALAALATEAAAAQRAVNTRRSYAAVYRAFCSELAAVHSRPPERGDLTAPAVRGYRDQLEREGRSPATIAHHLSALRQLADRLDADPAIQRVHAGRVAAREPDALERAEYDRLLAMPDRRATAGKRDLAVLTVLGDAGLRRSELCALTYDDVAPVRRHRDPRLRPAVADRPGDQTEYIVHVRRAKRGKARSVPLSRAALTALVAWRDARPTAATDRIFVSLPRTRTAPAPLSPNAIGEIVAKHARAAGLPEHLKTALRMIAQAAVPAARATLWSVPEGSSRYSRSTSTSAAITSTRRPPKLGRMSERVAVAGASSHW